MATATKSRASDATSQLATLPERVAVVETKVHAIEEKLDELKIDVKEMHNCLDNTRDLLDKKLCEMAEASGEQHKEIFEKIANLEKLKNKVTMYAMAGLAFLAGAGWLNSVSFPHIIKFLGI
jgi:tetrahydromethanopterin S-methyltransferase subunit B